MNSEDDFRRAVIQAAGSKVHVSHIESHQSSAGIPDLNLYGLGQDLWLELKVVKEGHVRMRPTQRKWHRDRAERGGPSWVAVLNPVDGHVLVVRGATAAMLATGLLDWEAVAVIRTHYTNFGWLALLLGGTYD